MNTNDTYHFSVLKERIATTFLQSHAAPSNIKDWKGSTITDFQEDLRHNTSASISEKWFYTYMKNDADKLPRIDMLNLLSGYVGFENWEAFVQQQIIVTKQNTARRISKRFLWMAILLPVIIFGAYSLYPKEHTFSFCFVDADKDEVIQKLPLDIIVLREEESSLYLKTDSLGCFSYKTPKDMISFVVKSPYHKTDTIVRHINTIAHKTVRLETDDYALMLLYYANGNKEDWKKRRTHLNTLIADDAKIYRSYQNAIGIELYTKQNFINLLTIPTSSLKNMHILSKAYKEGKIVKLKFIIK